MTVTMRPRPIAPVASMSYPRWPMVGLLMAADILSLSSSATLGFYASHILNPGLEPDRYWQLLPALLPFILAYSLKGLYPGIALSGPDELRRLSRSTTLIYLALGATSFLFPDAGIYSRGAFLLAWICSLALVPLSRAAVRSLFAHKSWWGYPVVVFGSGKTAQKIVQTLKCKPELGLNPVAVLNDASRDADSFSAFGDIQYASDLTGFHGIRYAIVAMPEMSRDSLSELLERYSQTFPNLLVMPNLFDFSSLWVSAKDLDGFLGFEVQQRLLMPSSLIAKRILDLAIALTAGLLTLPLIAMVALLTWLDSPGPILFAQERPGIGGQLFKILKFRTMHIDAEERFNNLSPELREEFKTYGKIKNDPRITRVGKWTRKLSLDELPQLWNVVIGDMSLVGPRPYLKSQVVQMEGTEDLILRVPPGITGIWQTSGRSTVTFDERLGMDTYYVRNWSVWLDLHILARTFKVIVFGDGAY
jgi:Undecaprenyl-phosphate galactose phosphotransferase WbaP